MYAMMALPCNVNSKYGQHSYFFNSIVFLPHGRPFLTRTCIQKHSVHTLFSCLLLSSFYAYSMNHIDKDRGVVVVRLHRYGACSCALSVIAENFHCSLYFVVQYAREVREPIAHRWMNEWHITPTHYTDTSHWL